MTLAGPVAAFADLGNSPAKLLEHDDPRFPFKMNFADDHRAVFLVDVDADGRAEGVRVISAARHPFVGL